MPLYLVKLDPDFRVLHGQKIVSRHPTEAEAQTALDAILRKPQSA